MTSSEQGNRRQKDLRRTWRALGLALLLASCQTPTSNSPIADSNRKTPPTDPVFEYLSDRYDSNGDREITREEYDRTDGDFARLDRNEDGLLTNSDFAKSGRRVRVLSPSEERRRHGISLLGWYFQSDDDPAKLTADELSNAFLIYDANQNGRVGRTEFEGISEHRTLYGLRPGGKSFGLLEVETTDPWERILRGVDRNDDGFLTSTELIDFHIANETTDAWVFDAATGDAPVGPLVGNPAPDFTLPTVDGSRRVTLSEFAGDRPVALIFGSWT